METGRMLEYMRQIRPACYAANLQVCIRPNRRRGQSPLAASAARLKAAQSSQYENALPHPF